MSAPEPELINSPLSQVTSIEEHEFHIEIYRMENETDWALEVVNAHGTSIVWNDSFPSDKEALDAALADLAESPQEFLG